MFIAIIGTILSGKSTVEAYLTEKGFVPVKIISRAVNYQVRAEPRNSAAITDHGPHFSFVDVDSDSAITVPVTDLDTPGLLTADSAHPDKSKLSFLSFLDSAVPSPISPKFQRCIPEQALCFTSAAELLEHVTRNWRYNFVTQDLRTEWMIQMFIKRPFFMVVGVDGPLSDRFRRAKGSLEAFVIANDADVYGRRHGAQHGTDAIGNNQVELSPLHSLQKYVTLHVINNFDSVGALRSYLDEINLLDTNRLRPSWDSYFMTLASLASMRSNCVKRRVGAILVHNKRIIATGYNGTPLGLMNCNEGGCPQCNGSDDRASCLCLHAEENALLEAGRERIGGATLYCNTCPCLTCTVKIVQTGVKEVVYNLSYKVDDASAKIFQNAGVILRRHAQPQ
ncbi:cytidine deaminase-like protein [Lactifluus subvellereus]|nr:cytidine deaminase-like protein [Lactifluus subvellereus]